MDVFNGVTLKQDATTTLQDVDQGQYRLLHYILIVKAII